MPFFSLGILSFNIYFIVLSPSSILCVYFLFTLRKSKEMCREYLNVHPKIDILIEENIMNNCKIYFVIHPYLIFFPKGKKHHKLCVYLSRLLLKSFTYVNMFTFFSFSFIYLRFSNVDVQWFRLFLVSRSHFIIYFSKAGHILIYFLVHMIYFH